MICVSARRRHSLATCLDGCLTSDGNTTAHDRLDATGCQISLDGLADRPDGQGVEVDVGRLAEGEADGPGDGLGGRLKLLASLAATHPQTTEPTNQPR